MREMKEMKLLVEEKGKTGMMTKKEQNRCRRQRASLSHINTVRAFHDEFPAPHHSPLPNGSTGL